MKNSLLMAALLVLPLSTSIAWADDDKYSDEDKQMHMGKMQEHMLAMHAQMHKIMDAKNPQEREQLMQEHTIMMQDEMRRMQGMMGKGMMGKGMMDSSRREM